MFIVNKIYYIIGYYIYYFDGILIVFLIFFVLKLKMELELLKLLFFCSNVLVY